MFHKHEEKIKNRLKELRTSEKMTQSQLADAAGVTRQTIIAIEKGSYTPSVLLALKLAKYFNVKVEDVFSYD